MGVRKTNCRGRLAKSGMTVGSLPQLANVLTIQELQNCKRCTSTNSSSPKKLSYLFGLPLVRPSTRRIGDRLINYVAPVVKWPVPYSTKFKVLGAIDGHGCGSFRD